MSEIGKTVPRVHLESYRVPAMPGLGTSNSDTVESYRYSTTFSPSPVHETFRNPSVEAISSPLQEVVPPYGDDPILPLPPTEGVDVDDPPKDLDI